MLMRTASLACCLVLGGLSQPAADIAQQLQAAIELAETKKYPEAIAKYEELLRDAPKPLHGPVLVEIGALHAASGNTDRALRAIDEAVRSGFDDCAVSQRDDLKPLRGDPAFGQLLSRIRMSDADLKELSWLKMELLNVSHETKMMIAENMNRVDTGITLVPQSAIPVRETASPAVLFHRALLKMTHQRQRQYVFQADKLRMSHVTKMRIISGGASAQQVALSSGYAQRNAEDRKRAIEARQFVLPPGVGTQPRPCGASGGRF